MKEKLTAVCTLIGILGTGIAEALGGWDKAIIRGCIHSRLSKE